VIVSVVAAVRRERGAIGRFLTSVAAQDLADADWEVIVADGMSDDGTREILDRRAREWPRLKVIDNPRRIAATGLNAAIQHARGEVIVRMDAHTEYAPDYLRECLDALERTGADNVGGPAQTRAGGWLARAIAAAFHSPFASGGAKFHNPEHEGPVDTVPYGCWRRATLERVGPFDETLVHNQDDELNLRIVRSGGRVWQSPRIRSWYRPRGTLPALFAQQFQYGFWKVAVIRKHGRPASWRHLAPGTAVLLAILLAALGSFWRWPLVALDALAGVWLIAAVVASLAAARRHGWDLLPALPPVFATYQLAYGLGFLWRLAAGWARPRAARECPSP
jgi:glycosyltransferase involved in cell wall biosynthesis